MNKVIMMCAALSCCLPLTATASIPLEQALELCRAEQNALRRLTCYDAIADNAPAQQSTSAGSAMKQDTKPKAAPTEQFGIEHKRQANENIEQLDMVVKSLRYSPHKELRVEFTNGQVWQQIGNDYYKIAEGEQHFIRRGVLNSFLLGNSNSDRTIRVKREK